MNRHLTEIAYILDRSGSMQSMQEPAIAGFNHFLKTQLDVPGDAHLTLVLFDDEYLVPLSAIPIQDAPKLDARTYIPRGSTALLDAIGHTIKNMGERLTKVPDADKPGKVIIAIFTDGRENASREFTSAHISDLIRLHRNEKGWEFIFLAANQDAIATAAAMSMEANTSANVSFCADGVFTSGAAVSRKVRAMRMKSSGTMDRQAMEDDAMPMDDIVREEEQRGNSPPVKPTPASKATIALDFSPHMKNPDRSEDRVVDEATYPTPVPPYVSLASATKVAKLASNETYPKALLPSEAQAIVRRQDREGVGGQDAGELPQDLRQGAADRDAGIQRLPEIDHERILNGVQFLKDLGGEEHDVYRSGVVVVKITKGVRTPDIEEYLERIAFANDVFGDDIRVLGRTAKSPDHKDRIVTVQPWVYGTLPDQTEINNYMADLGFEKAMDGVYYREKGNVWITDLLPKNALKDDDGNVHVIDFLKTQLSERIQDRFLDMIEGQKRI